MSHRIYGASVPLFQFSPIWIHVSQRIESTDAVLSIASLTSVFRSLRSQYPVFKVRRRRPGPWPVAARELTIRAPASRGGQNLLLHGSHTTPARDAKMPLVGQRRPALPRTRSAVPSALGGLTSGFGMGPGVPPLPWPLAGTGHSCVHPCPGGRTALGNHLRSILTLRASEMKSSAD